MKGDFNGKKHKASRPNKIDALRPVIKKWINSTGIILSNKTIFKYSVIYFYYLILKYLPYSFQIRT